MTQLGPMLPPLNTKPTGTSRKEEAGQTGSVGRGLS